VSKTEFKDLGKLDIVGVHPDYAGADAAWQAKVQVAGDNGATRDFIVQLHHLLDPESPAPRR